MLYKFFNYVNLRGLSKDKWQRWKIIQMVFGKPDKIREIFELNDIEYIPNNIKIWREMFSNHLAVLLTRKSCVCGLDKEGKSKHPLELGVFLDSQIEIPSNCPSIDFNSKLVSTLPTISTMKDSQPSVYWGNLLDYLLEEIAKADLDRKLVEYDIGSTPEVWQDRITRWFKFYFEQKDYYEIDDEHGDNSSKTYISRVRKFLDISEMNHVKERVSERYITNKLSEAVKTKSPENFSSFAFLNANCQLHREADMPSDLCIHFRDKHLLSINIKFTLKSPDKFLAATPEINFRPAALLLMNVDYSKRARGAYLAFKILAKEEEGERLKRMAVVKGSTAEEMFLIIAEKIITLINNNKRVKQIVKNGNITENICNFYKKGKSPQQTIKVF
ncbi:MAG: hypothetical protein HZR80_16890 [Candidatus Heimdallarchaeota archaeon]